MAAIVRQRCNIFAHLVYSYKRVDLRMLQIAYFFCRLRVYIRCSLYLDSTIYEFKQTFFEQNAYVVLLLEVLGVNFFHT